MAASLSLHPQTVSHGGATASDTIAQMMARPRWYSEQRGSVAAHFATWLRVLRGGLSMNPVPVAPNQTDPQRCWLDGCSTRGCRLSAQYIACRKAAALPQAPRRAEPFRPQVLLLLLVGPQSWHCQRRSTSLSQESLTRSDPRA